MRWREVAFAAAAALGCGTGGAPASSPEGTPISGATGYHKVSGAYIISLGAIDLGEPAVLASSPAGPFSIWMTVGASEIWRSELPRLGTDATLPRQVMTATESFEEGRVAAPSVEKDGAGWHLAYEAAAGIVARADSPDGETWTARRPVVAGHKPSLARGRLFYELNGVIWMLPTEGAQPVQLLSGTSPDVHVRESRGGQVEWQLFYNCAGRGGSVAICFAGSFDGSSFVSDRVPVLQADSPDELGPAAIVGSDSAALFFGQAPTGSHGRIAAAVAP